MSAGEFSSTDEAVIARFAIAVFPILAFYIYQYIRFNFSTDLEHERKKYWWFLLYIGMSPRAMPRWVLVFLLLWGSIWVMVIR